jgi:hypothetical protein
MRKMKCCPKCGSTDINPLAFYLPSIWKCSDCGYEGAFIIEGSKLTEEMQERYRKGFNIIDRVGEECCMNDWDGSTDNWPKTLEDCMKSVATIVEDTGYVGLRL